MLVWGRKFAQLLCLVGKFGENHFILSDESEDSSFSSAFQDGILPSSPTFTQQSEAACT
jgi:hypothetical protein